MRLYVIEEDNLIKLQKICDTLHGGSDKMRDEGHKLWLILNQIERLGDVDTTVVRPKGQMNQEPKE